MGKCGIAQCNHKLCMINSSLHALGACSAMTPYFYLNTVTVFKNTCNLLLWLSDLYIETNITTKRKFP